MVPSHGVRLLGQTYAIDILHPRPPGTACKLGRAGGMRRPEEFPTFGEEVLAVADGTVVRVVDGARDHQPRESWPAVVFLMVVEALVRLLAGARAIAGNHVVVDHGDGSYAILVHLERGSPAVRRGDRVSTGQLIGPVGNSGNTTEPHLHFQLTDDRRPAGSAGVPFRWRGVTIEPGDVDGSWSNRPVDTKIVEGLPGDGQVFTAEPPSCDPRVADGPRPGGAYSPA